MLRSEYFNYIEEKLHTLARRIETRGKLNLLDLHLHSENFYLYLFNLVYNYELINLNDQLQNVEAIDLIDHRRKVLIQVSAKNTKQKLESALNKKILNKYNDYNFKFISISKPINNLKKNTYSNPYSIIFSPNKDIYDIVSILKTIKNKDIEKLYEIYSLIKKELGEPINFIKLDSNLASIINILAKEDWDDVYQTTIIDSFEIDRKITYNELKKAKDIIKEYCIYYNKVDEKYSEFDTKGVNKSNSVLASMRREYLKNKDKNPDSIFFAVINSVKEKVLNSQNFINIPIDELDLCIDILVVDAFIRCKIFENPKRYKYVTP